MNSKALVSVIIPVYNGEAFIEEALSSVFSQEHIHEIIVVDDGSVDSTLETLSCFRERIKILKQTRKGAAAARNLGLNFASAEYIAFLDADDLWMPKKISKQLSILESNPELDMIFGYVEEYLDQTQSKIDSKIRGIIPGISPITLLARRKVFQKVGQFSTKWKRGEFVDWQARAVELGIEFQVLPDILARRRVHSSNSGHCEASAKNEYASIVASALRRRRYAAQNSRQQASSSEKIKQTPQLSTPVVLIIFNRPELTKKIFESLRIQRPQTLYIISDGARTFAPDDHEKVAAARSITEQIDWPCDVKRLYADHNIGIKNSYDQGLDWVFKQSESAIILEDDCLPSYSFFKYCSDLLEYYSNDPRIMLISGMNLLDEQESEFSQDYRFSRYPLTWGWATWRRAWQLYNPKVIINSDLQEKLWLSEFFQQPTAVKYWHHTFAQNSNGYTHWDIAWARSCFKCSGFAVHPSKNLITNIGFGEEATHAKDNRSIFSLLPRKELTFPLKHPAKVLRDSNADELVEARLFGGNLTRLFKHLRKSIHKHDNQNKVL